MRIDPVPPTYRLVDRRSSDNERRTASDRREPETNERRRHPRLTTGILAAPFGAHILGQIEPSPVSARRALLAYRRAARA